MKIKKELENVIEKYYNNQFDLYKKMMMEDEEIKKKESDEEIKWSVMEFVMVRIDEILDKVSEKRKV